MTLARMIKRTIGVLLCIIAIQSDASPGSSWLKNFEEAKAQALRENKLILADFWADWCGPCIEMEKRVWSNSRIRHLSSKFVLVKVDFDVEKTLVWQYNVEAIPAMLFLDGFGNKLSHIIGYQPPEQMEQIMQVFPQNVSGLYELLEKVETEPDNGELLMSVGDSYRQKSLYWVSNEYYSRASKTSEVKKNPELLDWVETSTGLNHLQLGKQKRAMKLIKKCMKMFPDSKNRSLQLFCMIKANLELGKEKRAREYYATLQKEFPDDKHTKWADELMNGVN